jgi:hypothetical protein
MNVTKLLALDTGRLYPQEIPQALRGISWGKSMKNSNGTFGNRTPLVAQCLNELHHRVPSPFLAVTIVKVLHILCICNSVFINRVKSIF